MRRAMLLTAATTLLGLLLAAGPALADTTIDTTPLADGAIGDFGHPDTATYGQVVTAPADDTRLDGFAFLMDLPDTVTFRGEVYAWDGEKAAGPNLYEGAPRSTSGSGGFEEVAFDTGGVRLAPGQEYVLFATISKDYEASSGAGSWRFVESAEAYTGGEFVFSNSGPDFGLLFTNAWYLQTGGDLAFRAEFSEPGYPFEGFFAPVENPPALNAAEAGSDVPVRFSLGGDEGPDIFAEGHPKSRRLDCPPTAPPEPVACPEREAAGGVLSYDATTERYTYLWETEEAWAGTRRRLVVRLDDGSVHKADFEFTAAGRWGGAGVGPGRRAAPVLPPLAPRP